MLCPGGMRERGDEQGGIAKLVVDPPLAFGNVDDALRPVGPLWPGLSAPLCVLALLVASIHACLPPLTTFLPLAKGTPPHGRLST